MQDEPDTTEDITSKFTSRRFPTLNIIFEGVKLLSGHPSRITLVDDFGVAVTYVFSAEGKSPHAKDFDITHKREVKRTITPPSKPSSQSEPIKKPIIPYPQFTVNPKEFQKTWRDYPTHFPVSDTVRCHKCSKPARALAFSQRIIKLRMCYDCDNVFWNNLSWQWLNNKKRIQNGNTSK